MAMGHLETIDGPLIWFFGIIDQLAAKAYHRPVRPSPPQIAPDISAPPPSLD